MSYPKDLIEKARELIAKGLDPYLVAYRHPVTTTAEEVKTKYNNIPPGTETEDRVSVAGRVWHIRRHGGIIFIDLYDNTGRIQLVVRRDIVSKSDKLKTIFEKLDKGDVIGVRGKVMRTKMGEISILVEDADLLAIAWRSIPFHEFGVKDTEQRYRERYLDLMLNSRARRAVLGLYKIEKTMRRILDEKGFIEVHTPKLQPVYGGALAKPFITKINALAKPVYLSISPETYLKRLVIAGFFKVYEIAVCFRNEDIDATHYPEFVQLEAYQAFADWTDMMELTEELVSEAVKEAVGDYKIEIDIGGEVKIIDFSRPWKRVRLEDSIEEAIKENIKNKSREELIEIAKSLGVEVADVRKGKIIEKLFEKLVAPKLKDPTFVTLFPRDISPLARPFREDPRYAERFELYINGLEVANGYTELNNPFVQLHFFREEEKLRAMIGVEEVHPIDRDYVRALEYGMPPTGGIGIGLYRLAMIVFGLPSIKDVIPFIITFQDDIELVSEKLEEIYNYYVEKLGLNS
ncbi:MAG: lysine--tRNA ligase [Acidilobaceae archaeon]